jgi:hypothetical protein
VLDTILQTQDGTAHWAHLSGFAVGMLIALGLVLSRGVNARGNDLLSAILGRHAWPLIGKPSQWDTQPTREGWLTRLSIRQGVKQLMNEAGVGERA